MSDDTLRPGDVIWAVPDPAVGREQSGRRPAVVVSDERYLSRVTRLVVVVPVTTVDRGWPNHVALGEDCGLSAVSFAMTEQPKTIDRLRIDRVVGRISSDTLRTIRQWVAEGIGVIS